MIANPFGRIKIHLIYRAQWEEFSITSNPHPTTISLSFSLSPCTDSSQLTFAGSIFYFECLVRACLRNDESFENCNWIQSRTYDEQEYLTQITEIWCVCNGIYSEIQMKFGDLERIQMALHIIYRHTFRMELVNFSIFRDRKLVIL